MRCSVHRQKLESGLFRRSEIRPLPPPPAADRSFEPLDVVDALVGNGWWKGFVSEVNILKAEPKSTKVYRVAFFENPPEPKQSFTSQQLRFHLVWTDDGKWVRPPYPKLTPAFDIGSGLVGSRVKIWWPDDCSFYEGIVQSYDLAKRTHRVYYSDGDIETLNLRKERWELIEDDILSAKETPNITDIKGQFDDTSSSLLEQSTNLKLKKSTTDNGGTLSNKAKQFRMENSAASLSAEMSVAASMLLNFAQKDKESALAKQSLRDLGASLPLNKGKSYSCTEQEGGSQKRMAKLPKKRAREPDARVSSQQIAAVEGELVKTDEMPPFKKSSSHWKYVESLEVFQLLPQKPHFRPLSSCSNAECEAIALGHMMTFATLVEKASELEIDKPKSLFDNYLKALYGYENHGFDVKPVVDCINEVLSLKTRLEELTNLSKEVDRKIAECHGEKAKLQEDMLAVKENFKGKIAALGRNLK